MFLSVLEAFTWRAYIYSPSCGVQGRAVADHPRFARVVIASLGWSEMNNESGDVIDYMSVFFNHPPVPAHTSKFLGGHRRL